MSYCIHCGTELPEGANFCPECGTAAYNFSEEDSVIHEIDSSSESSRVIVYEGESETPPPLSKSVLNPKDEVRKEELEKPESKREIVYEGKIVKCPNCGAVLDSFIDKCPQCGMEIRKIGPSNSVSEFSEKLRNIDKQDYTEKLGDKINRVLDDLFVSDKRKIALINTFVVPNTKEDLLEFMILATTNIDVSGIGYHYNSRPGQRKMAQAWDNKIEQVYLKAQRVLQDEEDFSEIKEVYDQYCKKKSKQFTKNKISWAVPIGILIAMVLSMFFLLNNLLNN